MNESDAERIHSDAVVVDAHNDLLGLVSRRPRSQQGSYFRSAWLPRLRAGGVNVQILPVYSSSDSLQDIVLQLEAGHRVAESNSDAVVLCRIGSEIDDALADAKMAIVLALEGCGALGTNISVFDTLFRLGVRVLSFTHLGRTAFADGSAEDRTGSRLTRAGVEALAAVEDLGILLDISHLSAAGLADVLERTTRPVVATHSSAFALCPHHRNLTDDQLKAVARSGGVVGVNFLGPFIDTTSPTVERVADHILHIASTVGIAHVGLGPDFIEDYAIEITPRYLEQVTPGLAGPESLPRVTDTLITRGLSDREVRSVLGANWLRVLRAEIGVPGHRRRERSGAEDS